MCSRTLKDIFKKRATQLELTIEEYIKYIAIKDIEETDIKQ